MATELIQQIPTTAVPNSAPVLSDDYSEIGGNTGGSRRILSNWCSPLACGVLNLTSATAQTVTFSYPGSVTLSAAPTRFNLTVYGASGSNVISAQLVPSATTTIQFQVELSGPPGDTNHQIYFEAFV